MDLLKSIIKRDEDGNLLDKRGNKVMQEKSTEGVKDRKPAPRRPGTGGM